MSVRLSSVARRHETVDTLIRRAERAAKRNTRRSSAFKAVAHFLRSQREALVA